jgi:hypothetical protein
VAEDHHLRPARSILLPLHRFHLRRRDHARTQLRALIGRDQALPRAMGGMSALGLFGLLCWRYQKSAQGRGRSIAERVAMVSEGWKTRLRRSPQEGPEFARKPSFDCDREIRFTAHGTRSCRSSGTVAKGGHLPIGYRCATRPLRQKAVEGPTGALRHNRTFTSRYVSRNEPVRRAKPPNLRLYRRSLADDVVVVTLSPKPADSARP